MVLYQEGGLWRVFSVFNTGFDVVGFVLARGVGTFHLVSGFLTKGIDPCPVVESSCLHREGPFRASSSTILLMSREAPSLYF